MKTQIYPPPGTPAPVSGFKIPSTILIVGLLVVTGAIAYYVITSKKKNNGKEEKIYSAGE